MVLIEAARKVYSEIVLFFLETVIGAQKTAIVDEEVMISRDTSSLPRMFF